MKKNNRFWPNSEIFDWSSHLIFSLYQHFCISDRLLFITILTMACNQRINYIIVRTVSFSLILITSPKILHFLRLINQSGYCNPIHLCLHTLSSMFLFSLWTEKLYWSLLRWSIFSRKTSSCHQQIWPWFWRLNQGNQSSLGQP